MFLARKLISLKVIPIFQLREYTYEKIQVVLWVTRFEKIDPRTKICVTRSKIKIEKI